MQATTVHMAVYDTFADWEVGHTTAHINKRDWQRTPGRYRVVTVGVTDHPVTSMGGMRVVPDTTLDELRPAESAMLILPGADTWMNGGNQAFAKTARTFLEHGVPVAAICGATIGLAAEGLLDHRPHTSNHPAPLAEIGYGGAAHYVDELAVTSGNLITASGVAPVEFAREVLTMLDVYEPEVADSWYKLYGRHDPAGFYELMESAA